MLVISILLLISLKSYEEVEFEISKRNIDMVFKGMVPRSNYIGYIEIDRLSIKKEIVLGINQDNLDKNHVVLSNSLDSDHIVLAGHSIRSVFLNLHEAIIGDEIKIHTYYDMKRYQIYDIQIVDKTDIHSIDDGNLVLITCMDNNNKRLLIKAKRI